MGKARIIRLQIENVKRIHAVDITPGDKPLVQIHGNNAQGKTTVLDSIAMVFGGKKAVPQRPVLDGEERGQVILTLPDLVVRCVVFPDGESKLYVETPEGMRPRAPQALLSSLYSALCFDPLAFKNLPPKEQRAMLARILGIDLDSHKERRGTVYAKRRDVNRAVARLKAQLEALPMVTDPPAAEVSAAELFREREELLSEIEDINNAWELQKELNEDVNAIFEGIERIKAALKIEEEKLATAQKKLSDQDAITAKLPEPPTLEDIDARIQSVDEDNDRFRAHAARAQLMGSYAEQKTVSAALTEELEAIDIELADKISSANLPIPGMTFDTEGEGVLLNGFPFEQASEAEALRASVALGIAQNPDLGVLLIRDGSLLDDDSMKLLDEIANEGDVQVWIERVGTDGELVIEDGRLLSPE